MRVIPYKRHDLVWLSEEGKKFALRNIRDCIPVVDEKIIEETILSGIPAIIRRQEKAEDGLLCIGFSSPRIIDGVRLRIGCKTPPDCIVQHKTPFDVASREAGDFPAYALIKALSAEGGKHHIQVGCFGSAALQMVTGLRYWKENSDLDIYLVNNGNQNDLEQFYTRLLEYEKKFGVSIDAEIEYPGQYGVKLKELFSEGKWVLGKGLYDAVLLEK